MIVCWLLVTSCTTDLLSIIAFNLKIKVSEVWLADSIARGYMNYWLFLLILLFCVHKAAALKVDSLKTYGNRLTVTAPSMQKLVHQKYDYLYLPEFTP